MRGPERDGTRRTRRNLDHSVFNISERYANPVAPAQMPGEIWRQIILHIITAKMFIGDLAPTPLLC